VERPPARGVRLAAAGARYGGPGHPGGPACAAAPALIAGRGQRAGRQAAWRCDTRFSGSKQNPGSGWNRGET